MEVWTREAMEALQLIAQDYKVERDHAQNALRKIALLIYRKDLPPHQVVHFVKDILALVPEVSLPAKGG